ncbi:MAG: hypothetical protein KGH75_06470 [Rhodospirillales bacterium]|nr:hypothetical protein [Rhodospirillales bacterium]
MLQSSAPTKIALPWANSGTKNSIPETTAGVTTPGLASFDVGFPPLTFTPLNAGGVPPSGADFNGIFNYLSAIARWSNAGGTYVYDGTFAADTNVNGYPKGAILLKSGGSGYWINQTDGNTTNPDTGGAGWADLGTVVTAMTTAAQFDSTTKPATTAFVQRALGSLSGTSTPAASIALTNAAIGSLVIFNGSTAGQTITMPPVAGLLSGASVWIQNVASVPVTVKGNAAETIEINAVGAGATVANTFVLGVGDSVLLSLNGAGWYEQQGVRAAAVSALGCGAQTWQTRTGLATGTNYTNSTGRAIFVTMGGSASGAIGYYQLIIGGIAAAQTNVPSGSAFTVSGIVPNGATYQLSKGGADTFASPIWAELR